MHPFAFLEEIALMSVAAVGVILIFNRFKIPPIIGLIATGLILGPSGLALVAQDEIIATVSELGVILLLFTIGLEFSIDDLKRLKNIVLVAGPLQILFSTLVIGAGATVVATWTNDTIGTKGAMLIGMAMALSSTASCTKILKERRELGLPHGRAVLGVLIFQDLAVVPIMIIVTLMSPAAALSIGDIALRLVTLVVVTGGLIIGLRLILPRLIPYVTRVSTPEVLILGGLAICFGTAFVSSSLGLSMALGAFLAGVAIAGGEEGHAIGRVLEPMKDAFTSIFFLSVGLLVNIDWTWMPVNIATAVAILVANAVVVTAILMIMRVNLRTAVMAGIILAQVGEFSFVIARAGLDYGVITEFGFQNMLVSIIITMIVTPTLITLAPKLAERAAPAICFVPLVRRWYGQDNDEEIELNRFAGSESGPVVTIIGAGVLGRNVASVLRRTGIPYKMLELNGETVTELRRRGEPVVQGDMTDEQTLIHAGVRQASVIIVAISDQTAIAQGVSSVRKLRPDALIIARTRYAKEADIIASRGADVVVTEEYESSIQVFVTVLEHLGVEREVIVSQEEVMRLDHYGLLGRLQSNNQ